MNPKARTLMLGVLCALALAWWAKMVIGTAQLAWHQGITWNMNLFTRYDRLPVLLAAIEFLLILGASLIPLLITLRRSQPAPRWIWYAWAPCIAYVLFMCINFFVRVPFAWGVYARGTARLLGWAAIAVLFVLTRRTAKSA